MEPFANLFENAVLKVTQKGLGQKRKEIGIFIYFHFEAAEPI